MKLSGKMQRASALLALLVTLSVTPGVTRADPGEEPDLQVEIVGLKAGSQRDVVVRVSNVSDWWSDVTTLTVETVSPNPGQKRTFDVPDINTVAEEPLPHLWEFTYTLPANCDGHVLKASVSAGSNYMGDKEINLANNTVQGAACAKGGGAAAPAAGPSPVPGAGMPSAPAGGSGTAPAPLNVLPPAPAPGTGSQIVPMKGEGQGPSKATTPEVFGPAQPDTLGATLPRPSDALQARIPLSTDASLSLAPPPSGATANMEITKAMSLSAIKALPRGVRKDFRGFHVACYTIGTPTYDPLYKVGWSEVEWYGNPCAAETWQVAVDFSEAITQIPDKHITKAVLTFDEIEAPTFCTAMYPGTEEPGVSSRCWRSGGGVPQDKPNGCVVVKLPTADWRTNFGNTMIPFSTDVRSPAVKQISRTEWDVTDPIRWRFDNGRPLNAPGQSAPPAGIGFLLTGTADIGGLEGQDSTSCVSQVSNFQLTITYTVPSPNDEPFRQPR